MQWLLGFLDPTGITEIIESIVAIYRSMQSAIQYAVKILRIIDTILDSIIGIAQGVLGPVATMLENALARGLPVVIGYLANLIGAGDIAESIQDIVGAVREKVDEGLDWLIDKAIAGGKALLGALGLGGEEEAKEDKDKQEQGQDAAIVPPIKFTGGGESHRLWVETADGQPTIMVASTPMRVNDFIGFLQDRVNAFPDTEPQKTTMTTDVQEAQSLASQASTELLDILGTRSTTRTQTPEQVKSKLEKLVADLRELLDLASHGIHAGTESDPIPIVWFKSISKYGSIQLLINGQMKSFSPTGKGGVPVPLGFEQLSSEGGRVTIGIANENRPETMRDQQKKLHRLGAGESDIARETDELELFQQLLAHYGFDWSSTSPDHVHDLGFGGFDEVDNLWPLNRVANVAANQSYYQKVLYLDGNTIKTAIVRDLEGKVFVIKRIE